MKKITIYLILLFFSPALIFAQETVGSGGTYSTLADAFTAINEGNITGNITLQIVGNCVETVTATLFQNGYNGTANYTSVTIYPTGSGYTINGDIDGPLIELNGASNITIDGSVNQSGSADLIITNINSGSSASTILFDESANANTIENCIIKGSGTGLLTSGVIFFSTSSAGSGNSSITIDRNFISGNGASRPVNAILSSGSAGFENSGNIISNNNIYDFLNKGLNSSGILLSLFSTTWTIQGNSFYETSSFTATGSVTYNCIKIDNVSGTGFSVSGNFIGGNTASCGGTAWTKSSLNTVFYGIYVNAGTVVSSTIQNNTIRNFSWSNSGAAAWTGIHIAAGNINIGTVTGNNIGDDSSTGSITVTGASNNTNFYGINIAGGGTVDCQNNIIGSVTTANGPLNSSNFTGINKTATSGTTTINNNTIGSLTQTNSISASSASTSSAQNVFGISNAGTGTITIDDNTIANLTNGTTNATPATTGLINGIKSTNGTCTISNNLIHDLKISNSNNSVINTASVCGIALTGSTLKTISGNTIYNLTNNFNSFAGNVVGMYFTGSTGANVVSENFIHSLSVTGASSNSASIYGIQVAAGAATYSNNIISLGGNSVSSIYGLYETGTATNNNNLYFNSVYISGLPASGALNSYALYSAVNTNTRDFRNNIFDNARSNSGATGTNYAVYIASSGGTYTIDYNDYYISGTGGVLGYFAGDIATLASWKTATGQDLNSLSTDPTFVNAGGTLSTDYLPSVGGLNGVSGTGILTDFNGATRAATPTMGAFEGGSCFNPTSGGTIAADQSGCNPFDPVAFTSTHPASGYTGTFLEYKWQESTTSAVAGFSDISGTNSAVYNAGVLTQSTWYKRLARVSCIGVGDWTGAAESNVLKVTVNAPPNTGLTVGVAGPVCSGSGTNVTVMLSESGVNYQLRNGVTPVGSPVAGNTGTINLPTGNLVSTTIFNVLATNTVSLCSAQLTQTATVNVDPLPNKNLVLGGTGSICYNTSTNITVAVSESGVNYQLRNDNANELVGSPVSGSGATINLPTGNITNNTQYNVLATNATTSCSVQLTEKEIVSIDPVSVGGTISGTTPVTYGSSTGTMTLSGYQGNIQRWEKRFNAGSWTTISNTSATYSETAAAAGTWGYRAVVKSGTCNEANSTEFSITVNKAALSITADNKTKNYGDALPVLTVTYSGFVNGDVAPATLPAISTTATAASPAAIYPITASGAADPNYIISYVAGTLTINKVPLTITADNKNKNYGAALPVLTVTYTGLVNGDAAPVTPPTISTTAVASSPVATYPVTATGAADPNYNITYVAGTLTINKVPLTITADNKNKNYGASLPALTVTYSGLVNGDAAPATPPVIATSATAASPAGTYPITGSGAADPNYNISYVAGTLTVNKVPLTITADNKSKNYGDPLPVLTVTYSGFVNGDIATATPPVVATTGLQGSGAGTYPITASGAADPNYNISYVAGTLTVNKVPLTITADNKNKNYGDALPVLTVTYNGFVNGDIATATLPVVSTTGLQGSGAGTYPITASGAADPNYTISYVAGTLTVNKVPLTITADNKSKNYGDALPVLTVTYSGFVNGDIATATPPVAFTTGLQGSDAGIYLITVSGASDPNYNISYVSGILTVYKVSLTVTAENKSKIYGDPVPALTITISGFIGTDGIGDLDTPPVVATTGLQGSDAGTYPIKASGGSDNNYSFIYVDGILTISKADQTITFGSLSPKIYGDSDYPVTASASSTLSVTFTSDNTSVATIAGNTIHVAGAGTAVIKASQPGNINYNAAPDVQQTLTVGKAGLTFTAVNKSKEYLTQNPVLTYTISGFVNGETQAVLDILPTILTTAVQDSPKGDYPITITGGSDNNYTYAFVPGILTITKVSQVITFSDYPQKLLVGDSYTLVAASTSDLPVQFESLDPSFATISGHVLTGVSKGMAQIRAFHPGDSNWKAAEAFVTVEIFSTHKDIMHLFTPNNDGINDYWELPDLSAWGKCDVKVYNRWGKLVFADANYNNLWEGTSNGSPLPEGPYYFIINTENAGVIKGTVNIVR